MHMFSLADVFALLPLELVSFLSNVMTATLQNLPDSIKTYVYFDALEHLATMLHVSCTVVVG